MRKFTTKECEDFLRRVDAELESECRIVLIGGGAVALKYKGTHATTDLDLWSIRATSTKPQVAKTDSDFWAAVERAQAGMTPPIPVERATIAEPPYNFEDRLLSLDLGLTKLTVDIPEAHDLVLMKLARAEAHDLDAIEDINKAVPLNVETLIERYLETKTQVNGSLENHRLNFLAAIARVFGEVTAADVDERTKL